MQTALDQHSLRRYYTPTQRPTRGGRQGITFPSLSIISTHTPARTFVLTFMINSYLWGQIPRHRLTGGGGVSASIGRRPARTFVLIFISNSSFWVFRGQMHYPLILISRIRMAGGEHRHRRRQRRRSDLLVGYRVHRHEHLF